ADEGIDHAVGFQIEGPLDVFFGRLKGLEVVGAVVGSGAVRARTMLCQFLGDIGVLGAALEDHVLQQVRHAAFTGALVSRADQVGDVHGGGWLGGIRKD